MSNPFDEIWLQAELECHQRLDKYAGFDFGEITEDEIKQRFAEIIIERCLKHVDAWTGTIYTPATNKIKFNIKQEFNL
jgi:hypothetical protein